MEYLNIIFHPSIILFLSATCLFIFYKYDRIFKIIMLIGPIISLFLLNSNLDKNNIIFTHINLIYCCSHGTNLVCSAFIIILLIANHFALYQNKKLEIIYGMLYGATSVACILAEDYISIFLCLELMMIFSSLIIFIGSKRGSITAAKRYFLTHFLSGNMILFGFIYLINKTGTTEITNLTNFFYQDEYSSFALIILLTGLIINIAAFPFSGWMVNYYGKASPSGFLYLISFTTKTTIILLIKFFAGFEFLKYIGAIMICYSCIKMIFEDNILRYLSYLSINAMGFMLLGISIGDNFVMNALSIYLSIHLLYKLIFSLCLIYLSNKDLKISKLSCASNWIIKVGLFISITLMLCVPGTATFSIKNIIAHHYNNNFLYILIMISTFITAYSLPWQQFLKKDNLQLDNQSVFDINTNIILLNIFLLISLIFVYKLFIYEQINIFNFAGFKQIIIVTTAIVFSYKFYPKRFKTRSINLVEIVGKSFFYCFNYFNQLKKEEIPETWSLISLESQIQKRFQFLYNQQTAIFIFIFIFLFLLLNALILR